MLIGFFDSGIGGISVLHEAIRQMPDADYIYYADTDNTPYGTKPKHQVRGYVIEAVRFIADQGVDAVVVACNTATSIAIEELRHHYKIPILGMEPAVKPAIEKNFTKNKRILVTATPLTLKEEKLKNLITRVGSEELVDLLPLPGLVEFAERFQFKGLEVQAYIKQQLSSFKLADYGTVVLGCTHFPFFKTELKKALPTNIDLIDGNEGTVKNLMRIMQYEEKHKPEASTGTILYYTSGRLVEDKTTLQQFQKLFEVLDLDNSI